jgi:hypothetical protein
MVTKPCSTASAWAWKCSAKPSYNRTDRTEMMGTVRTARDYNCQTSRMRQRLLLGCWVGVVSLASGCQCWGPSATCLRPEGPVASRAETLRKQHLERSNYYRDVPMFEHYLDGGPDAHQQVPSRFHPVPTRKIFQSPTGGFGPDSVMEPAGNQPLRGNAPNRSSVEELPLPRIRPDNFGSPNLGQPTLAPTPAPTPTPASPLLDLGPQASSDLLHRQLIQYPHSAQPQQQVADWVRGNYVTGSKESLRLHSALRTPGNDPEYR